MKKILKIIFINLIILFCLIEGISYIYLCRKYNQDIKDFILVTTGKKIKIPYLAYKKVFTLNADEIINKLRPVEYRNKDKSPVWLFGCSYTYGFALENNETFSHKLADYTGRTIVNRGYIGTGIPFFYKQISENKILNDIKSLTPGKEPDYIIFTLIPDHFGRMFRYRNWVMSGDHTLRYKIDKNGNLIEDKSIFLPLHSLFTSIVLEEYNEHQKTNDSQNVYNLFDKYIDSVSDIIKKQLHNTKFVILYLKCPLDNDNDIYEEEIRKEAVKNDIIYINLNEKISEIKQDKYWIEDKSHPNAAAWDKIVPVVTTNLMLK